MEEEKKKQQTNLTAALLWLFRGLHIPAHCSSELGPMVDTQWNFSKLSWHLRVCHLSYTNVLQ